MAGLLDGRSAIVTGGGSGIGRARARAHAAEGATVCVADLDEGAAGLVSKEIAEEGGDAFALCIDVTRPEDATRMVEEVTRRSGRLDIAHLNAGIAVASSILACDLEAWDRVMDVNLRGAFLGMCAVAKPMVEAGSGSIVVTASVAGLLGGRGMASYYASKHGVIGLVRAATAEFAASGVRVNAVCPGVIDTPILGGAHGDEDLLGRMLAPLHPLGRVGRPEEVANLVVFLASDRAQFMTGAALTVDGGLSSTIGGVEASRVFDADDLGELD